MTNWNWQRLLQQHVATCKSGKQVGNTHANNRSMPSICQRRLVNANLWQIYRRDAASTKTTVTITVTVTFPVTVTTHVPSIHKPMPMPPLLLLLRYLHNKHFGGNCQRSLKCKMCQMRKHFFSLSSRQLEAARGFSFLSQLTEKWRKMSLNWRVNKINLPFAWREKMRTHRFCKWSKQQQMTEWGRGTASGLSPSETNRMRFMYKSRHLLAWVTRAATTTAMATATTTATFHLCHEISLASFRNCHSERNLKGEYIKCIYIKAYRTVHWFRFEISVVSWKLKQNI